VRRRRIRQILRYAVIVPLVCGIASLVLGQIEARTAPSACGRRGLFRAADRHHQPDRPQLDGRWRCSATHMAGTASSLMA